MSLLYPANNFNFASQTFTDGGIVGVPPLTKSYKVSAIPDGSSTTTYDNFVLMMYDSSDTTGLTVVIYDSTAEEATFAGYCYSNDADWATISTDGGLAVPIAFSNPAGTLVPYASLVGYNSGTTDIDALITAGKAIKIVNWNGTATTMVQFNTNMAESFSA
jgi:hypothetical protein